MNVKTTIILLVLLILGVSVLVYHYSDWFHTAGKPQEDAEHYVVKGLRPIQKVQLEGKGMQKKIVLERKDGTKWYITQPISAPASDNQAERTVANLTHMVYDRKFGPKDADRPEDKVTGLSDPERIATITDDKGKSATVRVGKNRPLSTQSYVELVGDPSVYITALDLPELLNKTPEDYRDSAIFAFEPSKAGRIEARGASTFVLRKTDSRWMLDAPVQARADQEKVENLIQSLADLKAEKFVNDNPSPADLKGYGLDNPRLVMTVEVMDSPPASAGPMPATSQASAPATTSAPASKPAGKLMTIAFGASTGDRAFAKLSNHPWVFQVGVSRMDDLQPKPDALRDHRVMEIGQKEPLRIEVTLAHAQSATLEKADGKWQMAEPFKGPAEPAAVEKLLGTLRELSATEFVEPKSFVALGLDPPNGKIVVHFKGTDKPATLLLGGTTGESGQAGFVREEGSNSSAVVLSAEFATLNRPAPAYWPLRLFEISPLADFATFRVEKPIWATVFIKRFAQADFRLLEPISAPADVENLRDLFEELRDLRAEKIVSLDNALPERFAKLKPIRVTLSTIWVVEPSVTQPTVAASAPATASAPVTQPATASAPASEPATQPATASAPSTEPAQTPFPPVLVVKDGNTAYAWVEGKTPLAVGQISMKTYNRFDAELRNRHVFKIDPAKAVSLKLSLEKSSMEFVRTGDTWRYTDDPFLKVEQERIKTYLTELSQLQAKRYVEYATPSDPQKYGLDNPAMVIEVKYDTGEVSKLTFSRTGPVGVEGVYGMSSVVDGLFVLATESPRLMQDSLQNLRKPAPATPAPMPMPGGP